MEQIRKSCKEFPLRLCQHAFQLLAIIKAQASNKNKNDFIYSVPNLIGYVGVLKIHLRRFPQWTVD